MRVPAPAIRGFRRAMILVALSYAAVVMPLRAQQARDSASVVPASAAPAVLPAATLPGPRLSAPFQSFEARLAPSNASRGSSYAAANDQHTIVFSTLALVLAVIIVVLLVTR